MSNATVEDLAKAIKVGQEIVIVDVRSDDELKAKREELGEFTYGRGLDVCFSFESW